ncbi:MAG: transglutaminase-like cysteine peptidase [Gammaproteobacteria bacterium]|jgi:predicted transglutaminase-like cysteine proteinase|nr:transglutaminase-like cysteine peptidase [Gammaproteobacteria bacterium]
MLLIVALACLPRPAAAGDFAALFGYTEVPQADISVFPQWLDVLEKQLVQQATLNDCVAGGTLDRCDLQNWRAYLDKIRHLPRDEQLAAVNRFANEQKYVLDIENYGLEDYWAAPELFLENGGDCEDYVIVKLFSLRWLGWPLADMRLVVVQDTNLRMAHAVLAVADAADVWILDNLVSRIVPERTIVHYAPVYSISERQWWLHLPRS